MSRAQHYHQQSLESISPLLERMIDSSNGKNSTRAHTGENLLIQQLGLFCRRGVYKGILFLKSLKSSFETQEKT